MIFLGSRLRRGFSSIWRASRPLTGVGLAFVVVLVISLVGLGVDHRQINNSPAWLKPVKFAISSALFCLTLAGMYVVVGRTSRGLAVAGWSIAVVLAMEVGIIDLQAARGVASHFNRATPLDAGLYALMGLGILILLLASVVVAVELFRLPIADRVQSWSIRLGMVVTVLGMLTGGLMGPPTPRQTAEAKIHGTMPIAGSHTVGGSDGGPGLPVTSWSRTHGDLRVPHFFGLHAIQAIPLISWLALWGLRLRSERSRVALVGLVSASYLALVALLTAQAMAGRPLVSVDLAWIIGWGGAALVGVLSLVIWDRSRIQVRVQAGRPLVMKGF